MQAMWMGRSPWYKAEWGMDKRWICPHQKRKENDLTQKQIETYRIKFIAALFAKAKHEKQVSIIGEEMSKLQ